VQEQTVRLNTNGDESERKITLTWKLKARGDALTGTLLRAMPAKDEPLPPSPAKGVRMKS